MTKHRSTTVYYPDGNNMLFAMVDPEGRLCAVVDAGDIFGAWVIGTGWEDEAGIERLKQAGWKMVPATVEWEE